jgi:hypothetical protein
VLLTLSDYSKHPGGPDAPNIVVPNEFMVNNAGRNARCLRTYVAKRRLHNDCFASSWVIEIVLPSLESKERVGPMAYTDNEIWDYGNEERKRRIRNKKQQNRSGVLIATALLLVALWLAVLHRL